VSLTIHVLLPSLTIATSAKHPGNFSTDSDHFGSRSRVYIYGAVKQELNRFVRASPHPGLIYHHSRRAALLGRQASSARRRRLSAGQGL